MKKIILFNGMALLADYLRVLGHDKKDCLDRDVISTFLPSMNAETRWSKRSSMAQ